MTDESRRDKLISSLEKLRITDTKFPEKFQKLFNRWMHHTNYTQAYAAEILGVSAPSISCWTRGVTCPRTTIREITKTKMIRRIRPRKSRQARRAAA